MAEPTRASQQHFTQAALSALTTADQLLSRPSSREGLVSPSDMYAYAVDPSYQPSEALLTGLQNNSRLQQSFQRMLRNTARYHMPQVAAASSGAIEQREAAGCKISFRTSRADDSQMYVIVESTNDLEFSPALLFVSDPNGLSHRIELPAAQNGRIQLLLDREGELVKELLDIKNEVYLK